MKLKVGLTELPKLISDSRAYSPSDASIIGLYIQCYVCDTGPNFLFDNVYVQFGIIILPKIALNLI